MTGTAQQVLGELDHMAMRRYDNAQVREATGAHGTILQIRKEYEYDFPLPKRPVLEAPVCHAGVLDVSYARSRGIIRHAVRRGRRGFARSGDVHYGAFGYCKPISRTIPILYPRRSYWRFAFWIGATFFFTLVATWALFVSKRWEPDFLSTSAALIAGLYSIYGLCKSALDLAKG